MSDKKIVKIDKDIKDIIPTFLDNRQKDLSSLSSAIQQSDFKSIEVIAHKLAGNAGSYGFEELGEIGMTMENAARDNKLDIIASQLELMKSYLTDLEIEFE